MTTTQQPEALNLEEFRAKVTRAAREPLLARIAELEASESRTITQRDHCEEVIDRMADAVLGKDRHEWTSNYDYMDAAQEVEDRIAELEAQFSAIGVELLHKQVVVPQGWKLVPVNLLERIQESLGSFVSDQGWSQSDMDTADALDGLLARDLVEDTDPDDATFDDFAEDVDDSECHNCSGTGEGMYDSQSCVVCLGKGFL